MERMIILTEKDYQELIDKYTALEEENKKLKDDMKTLESAIGDLVRENRELKEERDKYYAEWHLRHS